MRPGPEMARQHHVHHAHDPESDDQDAFVALEARAAQRLDHARRGLDQHAVGVAERVGQTERVALVVRAHHEILGHPARHDFGRAPGRALHVLAAPARRALEARRVMMDEDALAAAKPAHRRADLLDHADRLVAQHQRRLAPDVPGHDVARADAAGAGAHQDFVGAGRRARVLLDADIAEIIKPCDLHVSPELCGPRRPLSNVRVKRSAAGARCSGRCGAVRAVLTFKHAQASMPPIAADVIAEIGDRYRADRAAQLSLRMGVSRRLRRRRREG